MLPSIAFLPRTPFVAGQGGKGGRRPQAARETPGCGRAIITAAGAGSPRPRSMQLSGRPLLDGRRLPGISGRGRATWLGGRNEKGEGEDRKRVVEGKSG